MEFLLFYVLQKYYQVKSSKYLHINLAFLALWLDGSL